MNVKETCSFLGVTESTLKTKFKRTQESALRNGYILTKVGKNSYEVETQTTMFKEEKQEIRVSHSWLNMSKDEFNLLLMIVMCPMKIFRGTYAEMCRYMEIAPRTNNYNMLKQCLEALGKKDLLNVSFDEDVLIVALPRKIERDYLQFCSSLVDTSRDIAVAKGIRSWISVVKVWLALRIIDGEVVTNRKLIDLTSLGESTIRKSINGLKEFGVLDSKLVYLSQDRCLGKEVNLNAWANI